ncbi:shikimate dehydrogenase [Erythrobacter sp. JK5]|uniref:shikimate dehydrogenase n=1 Tax=Erythrobacter sp. JK5 TaxID=2829500 RepID=UPI001BABDCA0|nr:shikimate dehydrogenase [Erythrobacter sp. JK5]QUL37272.1 shikimate dehydrogenase [Erythrobacter sp. JK5]
MSAPYAQVIGDPIAQSKSPLIHGFWLEKLGLDAAYDAVHVTSGGLAAYIADRVGNADWRGCNVTMPHKQAIIPMLDRLDPIAARIGAVNTAVREGRELVGYNTDADGFIEPLQPFLDQDHLFRMARIIGSGGAARAIITALAQHRFTLVVAARNPDKARALLDELAPDGEHYAVPIEHFAGPTDFAFDDREQCFDLVINASPLGMRGQPSLAFDWTHAPPGSIAYDIVTDPVETAFLAGARASGLRTIGGLAMLIGQAATAFERFFGMSPPREFDAELLERLQE